MSNESPNRLGIENALACCNIWAKMTNGRYWRVRRNGATKLWVTRPDQFRIPVKAGFKSYGYIDHTSIVRMAEAFDAESADFVISAVNPAEVKHKIAV